MEFKSEEYPIMAGDPQGIVMGPILYVLFTAHIKTSAKVLTSTFADDTAILRRSKCPIKKIT